MNINRENLDDLNAIIKIQIEPNDYEQKVETVLKDYRKKAKFDGFRPGKAPFGMVKKLYGTPALLDEVNNLLTENLNKYLVDNNLRILGEPLPNENSPAIDWENQASFEFAFDIALAPEFELNLSTKDKIDQYIINVDDKIIDEQVEHFCQRYGSYEQVEQAEENDLLKGDFIQLDGNMEPVTDGIRAEDAIVSLASITDDSVKNMFLGIKANSDIDFDPALAFPNEADRAAMLHIKKDDLPGAGGMYRFTVSEVSRFQPATVNQELFDRIFGEGTVNSEEEFREKIRKDIENQFSRESMYKFHIDTREKLIGKYNFELPDEFLKRWMIETSKDENLTREKIEEEYPAFRQDLRWQLIKEKIIDEQSITAEKDEIKAHAVIDAQSRFQQYGMYDVPQDQLIRLANSILSHKEEERKIIERIQENKVINFVKESVKVEEKNISLDEFKKLFD